MFRYVKTKATAGAARSAQYAGKVVNAAEIAETATTTRDMLRRFWATRKGTGRCETFQNAVQRHGWTEDDLRILHRQHAVVAHIAFFFIAIAACLGAWNAANGSMPGAFAALGAVFALSGMFLKAAFRAQQIERRDLFPFPVFLRAPLDWLPSWSMPAAPVKRVSSSSRRQVRHDR